MYAGRYIHETPLQRVSETSERDSDSSCISVKLARVLRVALNLFVLVHYFKNAL